MKLSNYVLSCIKYLTVKKNEDPSGDDRMNIPRMIIMTLILGLLGQLYAYAGQPLKLEAKEGFYQFPFFDIQTPVWSYNDQIPGPLIRSKVAPRWSLIS
jgi:hypothetical protein